MKRRPLRAAIAFLEPRKVGQSEFDQSEVMMDKCFFCDKAIENEDEYILFGLVQDEAAELVPAHQDCASSRSDHVELFRSAGIAAAWHGVVIASAHRGS